MSTKIRWGILATGTIAAEFAADLQLLPDAELVAVGSRSQESADAFAARFGIPRAHGSWEALAADDEVDVVYVATPHSAHFAAAELCLKSGRAVLCEKPFTLNAGETRQLVELAQERGLFLMEAMWTRCNPAFRRVLELIAEGAIGTVGAVLADFNVVSATGPEHRMRNPALGGGALLDLGVYPLTVAHAVLGMPNQITARAALTPEGVDANTGLLLGWEGGAMAALTCGLDAETGHRAVIAGDLGRIEIAPPFFRPDRFTLYRNDGTEAGEAGQEHTVPRHGTGYTHEAEEVMRCLRAGLTESPLVPWRTSVEVMDILDTARRQMGVRYPGDPA